MRDAVQLAIGWLKKAHKEKKVLVVVTDGEDNSSDEDNSLENVVRSARQNEVLIYSVGLLSEEDHKAAANAKHQLNELSEATGGEAFYPKDVTEVEPMVHQVARDLRSQYTIEYTPVEPGDGRHFPQDSGDREGLRRRHGAHPHGLLRHSRSGRRASTCASLRFATIIEATMLWKPWRLFLSAGALAMGIAALSGQPPKPGGAPQGSIPVYTTDTRLVVCHTTVVDKTGRLVTNLKQDAFTVSENDVKQDILIFKREDIPVSMGLIIDNSGSMRPKRTSVEAAALALVKDSNPEDEVFIVNFNDDAYIDNPHGKEFLTDVEEMKDALTRIDSRGGTAMRDAIGKSIEWLKKAHKEKKVLVVVTDGVDNASTESLEDLVREARQSEVLIYSMGLLTDEEKRSAASAKRQLNALAEATGGEVFYPKELADVEPIAHQVARDIRSQYTIGYKPGNEALDGTFRRIKVTVKAPGNLVPRTRTGYYATADLSASRKSK